MTDLTPPPVDEWEPPAGGTAARKPKRRPAGAWPFWKLRALLPDSRRWKALCLVELAEEGRPWQFQTFEGKPAGVGLFATREWALKWAKTHCERVLEEPPAEAAS